MSKLFSNSTPATVTNVAPGLLMLCLLALAGCAADATGDELDPGDETQLLEDAGAGDSAVSFADADPPPLYEQAAGRAAPVPVPVPVVDAGSTPLVDADGGAAGAPAVEADAGTGSAGSGAAGSAGTTAGTAGGAGASGSAAGAGGALPVEPPPSSPTSCRFPVSEVILTCANQQVYGWLLRWSVSESTTVTCLDTGYPQCVRGARCTAMKSNGTVEVGACQ